MILSPLSVVGTPKPIDYPAWITALAALVGVPLSLVAFIKLIMRDKKREKQIASLATIAATLENQTSVMQKHNDLVAMQVEILRGTSLSQGDNKEAIAKLQDIEEQKLRLSVQPRLWLNGANYVGWTGELEIDLNNKGEVAHLDDFVVLFGDIMLHSKSVPYDLEKGERRYIFARNMGAKHIKDTVYSIEILYHNALNQPYHAIINGMGATARIVEDEPIA